MWPCRRARGSSCNNETTPFVTEALPPLLINVQSYRRSVVVVPHATCSTDRPFAFGSFAFARIVISRATASLSFLPPLSLLFHRSAHGNARIRLSLSLYIYMHTLQLASSSLFPLPFLPPTCPSPSRLPYLGEARLSTRGSERETERAKGGGGGHDTSWPRSSYFHMPAQCGEPFERNCHTNCRLFNHDAYHGSAKTISPLLPAHTFNPERMDFARERRERERKFLEETDDR